MLASVQQDVPVQVPLLALDPNVSLRDREQAARGCRPASRASCSSTTAASLQRRLAVAEQIVGHRHARRQVAERPDLLHLAGVRIDARLRGLFALRRQQVRPDHVLRHAAAVVLRVLPVVAHAAVDACSCRGCTSPGCSRVAPPDAVAQLVAVELGAVRAPWPGPAVPGAIRLSAQLAIELPLHCR